jgi:hypothetical protein
MPALTADHSAGQPNAASGIPGAHSRIEWLLLLIFSGNVEMLAKNATRTGGLINCISP